VLVELVMVAYFVLLWYRPGALLSASAAITTALNTVYGAIGVLVLVTDLEHRLVLHAVMLPAIALAALAAFVNPAFSSPARALLGGALGLICALALYFGGMLFARLLGRMRGQPLTEVAFGFGDVTLITFIGLVVGVPEILFALVIGILSGGLFGLFFLLVRWLIQRRYTLFTAIPYAPFLLFGGAVMLFYGQEILSWYLRGTV
jgi:prepilin signal peptidase PulO-like enzyme (type II secretory pathway)